MSAALAGVAAAVRDTTVSLDLDQAAETSVKEQPTLQLGLAEPGTQEPTALVGLLL